MALTKIQFTIEKDLELKLQRYCTNGPFTSRRDCINELIRLGLGANPTGEGHKTQATPLMGGQPLTFYS